MFFLYKKQVTVDYCNLFFFLNESIFKCDIGNHMVFQCMHSVPENIALNLLHCQHFKKFFKKSKKCV